MLVGVPKEIKDNEFRVSVIPATVEELVRRGHRVLVETGAGIGAGLADAAYESAGAEMVATAGEVFERAELIVKVKEPLEAEQEAQVRPGPVHLHLAADFKQTEELLDSGVTAIACETVTGPGGMLPPLMPMSEVAGRMAPQVGAYCLEKITGRRGLMLGGVPGVLPPSADPRQRRGRHQCRADRHRHGRRRDHGGTKHGSVATSLGAVRRAPPHRLLHTTERRDDALSPRPSRHLRGARSGRRHAEADLSRDDEVSMKPGAVIVDVSIDQGGTSETSRPTTHSHPTYIDDGVVHYCVTNMPVRA
jgi:alanine dehydrogenase